MNSPAYRSSRARGWLWLGLGRGGHTGVVGMLGRIGGGTVATRRRSIAGLIFAFLLVRVLLALARRTLALGSPWQDG